MRYGLRGTFQMTSSSIVIYGLICISTTSCIRFATPFMKHLRCSSMDSLVSTFAMDQREST
jgi:hypothetical protein